MLEDKPFGRPTEYNQDIASKICSKLAEGISLRTICLGEDMPTKTTVFNWLAKHKDFVDQYARAKEESADAQFENLDDIGDEAIEESKIVDPKAASAVVSAYKLKADNLKWTMSKMKPKKYGDKLDVMSDGKAIVGNTIIFKDFKGDEASS